MMRVLQQFEHFDELSLETGIVFDPDEGRTQQQFAEESDINEIVRRFGITGTLPENPRPPMQGDFTELVDFRTALDAVRKAEEGFMEFPGELRARFGHDPQRMLEFLADDSNREEAIKLGLVAKPGEVTRDAVTAIDDLAKILSTPKS